MYAKLTFGSSVKPAEMARDIARVLSESDGASGATLGACEFIDSSTSSISDTEASTWSLVSPSSLRTGSVSNADKYIMKSSHTQSGKYKYAEVGYNGSTSMYNNTTLGGFRIMPVLDGEESTERLLGGYNSTNSTYTKFNSLQGTIHVVANSKCLLIWGRSRYELNGAPVTNMQFLMETVVTPSSAYRENAPYLFLNFYSHINFHTQSYQASSDMNGPSSTSSSSWARGGPGFYAINMYDPTSSTNVRALQFQMTTSSPAWGGGTNNLTAWNKIKINKDVGTTSSSSVEAPAGWDNVVGCMVGDLFAVHNYSLLGTYRRAIDSSGNSALPLFPISIVDPLMLSEFLDASTSPVYMTYGGQGSYGDTLTISSEDYFYIPMEGATRGAYMVKLK
jgi:hypothetical protein